MVILHFADVHARDKGYDEIKACLAEIIQVAHDNAPDLIVMAGDTFDSRMVRLDSQAAKLIFQAYQALADIAPMVVVVGTPSHDGMAPEVLEQIRSNYDIWVPEKPEQFYLSNSRLVSVAINPEAVISCIPAPTKKFWEQSGQENQDIDETDQGIANALGVMMAGFGATAAEYDVPHILVGHFTVGGAQLSPTQTMVGRDIEISREQIGYAQADLVCLGHIHLAQDWIDDHIFYSGSISRLSFGELEDKGCYLHTIENGILHSEFHKTPSQKRLILSPDLTKNGNSIEAFLVAQKESDLRDAHVRLDIRVFQDEAGDLDEDLIRAILPDVDIHIQRVPRETVRSAQILKVDHLRDKLTAMAELRKEEIPAAILTKADHLETMQADELLQMVSNG